MMECPQGCLSLTVGSRSSSLSLLYEGAINLTSNMSHEQRLFYTLMTDYERVVRPVRNSSEPVVVKLGISLTQILDIDERNQIMSTNIWLDQEWYDEHLNWNPNDFGGLKKIRIPCHLVWLPDIVLYNSADDYTQGYMQSLAMINYQGNVFWPPIVKFRSTCKIDITWFPFDDQLCFLKFGSWTYDSTQLTLVNRSVGVDMSNYIDNGEWKLLKSWTVLSILTYPCCPESYHDLKFYFHIRRRTQYYTFNVIIPCIMLSGLTCLTFYLPTESGEKVSLGLTVLLAFSVFMLLIAESMPATSEFIPLIGIYFTIVMGLTSLSVVLAVLVLNIHVYGSTLRPVPRRLRRILFQYVAPRVSVKLYRSTMRNTHRKQNSALSGRRSTTVYNAVFLNDQDISRGSPSSSFSFRSGTTIGQTLTTTRTTPDAAQREPHSLHECKRLLFQLNRLILRSGETREEDSVIRDWQNVALVIDRCLFYLYITVTTILTVLTLVLAPLMKIIPQSPKYFQLNITKE